MITNFTYNLLGQSNRHKDLESISTSEVHDDIMDETKYDKYILDHPGHNDYSFYEPHSLLFYSNKIGASTDRYIKFEEYDDSYIKLDCPVGILLDKSYRRHVVLIDSYTISLDSFGDNKTYRYPYFLDYLTHAEMMAIPKNKFRELVYC